MKALELLTAFATRLAFTYACPIICGVLLAAELIAEPTEGAFSTNAPPPNQTAVKTTGKLAVPTLNASTFF